MSKTIRYAEFGPAEVALHTGVTQEQQRDWRRRGVLLKSEDGKARYTSIDLAEIVVRKELQAAGVPLTKARNSAAVGAMVVVEFASRQPGALSGCEASDMPGVSKDIRYLVVPQPLIDPAALRTKSGGPISANIIEMLPALWIGSLDEIEETINRLAPDRSTYSVIDLKRVGERLADIVERPLAYGVGADESPLPQQPPAARKP